MLHTRFFANEVQRVDVKVGPAKFSDKEMQLASQLPASGQKAPLAVIHALQ
jgi:hypothetical protein